MPGLASIPADRFLSDKLGSYLPLSLLLIFITLLVFSQVREFDFTVWDDPLYVTSNMHVQTGLHWESVRWAFTTHEGALWHPLTWLSHMLDYQLYGLSPAGHHLTNLFWHLLSGLLLFRILQLMTGEIWPSFLVALLFAVHPLRAESVAWVAERKDVMSVFFWLLTTLFYLRYVKTPLPRNYIPVAVALGLGLMFKSMLVTLPFALLLLDFWPLRRVRSYRSWASLLKEKIPLFILVLLSILLTMWALHSEDAVVYVDLEPLSLRIENAIVSYVTYIHRTFWPAGLSVIYPFADSIPLWKPGAAFLVLGGCSWFVWRFRHRFPYALVGWLWFVGTLVPVIGIVQVCGQASADRYTYISTIGLFIIMAWGIRDYLSLHPSYRRGFVLACACVVIVLAALCHTQVQYWRNSITLFQHALNVQENNAMAHAGLGAALIQNRNPELAEKHLRRALEIHPRFPEALNDLGGVLVGKGLYREAMACFSDVLALNPHDADAHNNLALTLTYMDRFPEAIEHYKTAIAINPMFPRALNNLGATLAQTGRIQDAKSYFLRALTIQPGDEEANNNLGLLYYQQQDYANAKTYFESGLRYNANNPKAYFFLGLISATQHRNREAANYFSQALRIDPNFREAQEGLERIQEK